MDFLIYITERCNLACKYCDSVEDRNKYDQEITYDINSLIRFLENIPDLRLHFYGGEPLLNEGLVKEILSKVEHAHSNLQTNGQMLYKLDKDILSKLNVISVSLDGPEDITDSYRGTGVYKTAIKQIKILQKNGYKNILNVRMTVNPGADIEKSVKHFISQCDVKFDNIHWQLNALFHQEQWENNKEEIKYWFNNSYNPKITLLIKSWAKEMIINNQVTKLIPFTGIIHSLLTNSKVQNLRCGAGWSMFAIMTNGNVYPCPVIREYPEYNLGNISKMKANDIKPAYTLKNCKKCKVFSLCGGRCLYSNHKNKWDEEGYELVCDSVKHLIRELIKVYPIIKKLISQNKISIDDFSAYQDYEVIP
ncbi:MAG: TIGR04084 family radical SAM/SPASM domain-containing protein [Candidatus Woesearchaeota archaeon]|jgi:putative peptide-modifying radical SAM enzyme|nr:TIGR04084 family radical SAM/SPASM domain-containing protein [Candidatus Woesearchaeota archaeon]|tara:strand:- start:3858 stop:4946 length:1089 start_codon:yes stop_codon:yes gene_type:complete